MWRTSRSERWCGAADAAARAVGLELSARRSGVEHLTDIDTAGNELVSCGLDVGHDQVEALGEPGAANVIFVPNWTEHPEPCGVNWTTRKPLSKGKSASSLHPRLS